MANNSASNDLVSFNSFKFNHGQTKNVFAVMGIWTPYLMNESSKLPRESRSQEKKELPDLLEIFGSFLVPSSNISNYFIMMKARKGQNYLSEISSKRRNSGNSVLHPSGQQDLQYRLGQSLCWSLLDFWKIKFEKPTSTNWIFVAYISAFKNYG